MVLLYFDVFNTLECIGILRFLSIITRKGDLFSNPGILQVKLGLSSNIVL